MSFANLISVLALFIALGGGAYAAVKLKTNQVKSKHIAPEAVQGIDANESSFGPVPHASQADNAANAANAVNAANADNAAALEGLTPADFQFGNGLDDAIAGFLDSGETGGIILFEGGVGITCGATPALVYEDTGGDGGVETDLWIDGLREEVADGDAVGPFNLDPSDTAQVHIWGGGGTVAHVVASVFWDATPTECRVAFTSQENLETGAGAASASARADRATSRGGRPSGWVTPSRSP